MTQPWVPKKNDTCPLCGDHRIRSVVNGKDFLHQVGGEFEVVACVSCGLWRQKQALDPQALRAHYPDQYKPYDDNRPIAVVKREKLTHRLRRRHLEWVLGGRPSLLQQPLKKAALTALARLMTLSAYYRFNPFAFKVEGRSLLDVGCADGHFLQEMGGLGWTPTGVEFHEKAAKRAESRGVGQIYFGDFIQIAKNQELKNGFDLITMRQVLEHFDDPFEAVRSAYALVRPGGFLAVWAPVTGGLASGLFRRFWYNLDMPRHRVLFSKSTLPALIRQGGFTVLLAKGISSEKSLTGSLGYWAGERFGPGAAKKVRRSGLISLLARWLVKPLDYVGLGDNLLVVARKPPDSKRQSQSAPADG